MSVYYLPALVGLIFKFVILGYALKDQNVSRTLVALIFIFAWHNSIELMGYLKFLDDQSVANLFRIYYAVTILGLMAIAIHSLVVSKIYTKGLFTGLIVLALPLILAVLLSDIIVAGNISIGYSVAAIKGQYYSVFSFYTLVCIVLTVSVLVRGYIKSKNHLDSIACLYSLFALAPLLIVGIVVLALKTLDININSAGIVPITTTLFLYIILKSESQHNFTDIRRFLPFSDERKTAIELLELTDIYSRKAYENESYNEFRNGMETRIILYTLNKCKGNITEASKMMGLQNRSTLYSMMNRLGINHKE